MSEEEHVIPKTARMKLKMKVNSRRGNKEKVGVAGAGVPLLMKQELESVKEPSVGGGEPYCFLGFFYMC